jgi:hypothetical protein
MVLAGGIAAGDADAILEVARMLQGRPSTILAFSRNCSRIACFGCILTPQYIVWPYTRAIALCSDSWASTTSTFFYKSGEPIVVGACAEYRLGREALLTGNPPQLARRNPEAVLYAYISRLIHDGVSLERIAAKLAAKAGAGAAILASLRLRRGSCDPRVYMAVHGSKKICLTYSGRSVAAIAPREVEGLDCRQNVVVTFSITDNIPRVEIKPLDRVLYG